MAATLDKDADGNLIRKAGVMGIVISDGDIRPGGDPRRMAGRPPAAAAGVVPTARSVSRLLPMLRRCFACPQHEVVMFQQATSSCWWRLEGWATTDPISGTRATQPAEAALGTFLKTGFYITFMLCYFSISIETNSFFAWGCFRYFGWEREPAGGIGPPSATRRTITTE
jgi:hypothetical protein